MNYSEGIIRYRNNGKHRYSCITGDEQEREIGHEMQREKGTVWPLFLWLFASPLILSASPPPVSFPFLHVYIIHITPSLMSLSLTLQSSSLSLCSMPSFVLPSLHPSSTQLPPLSRLYLLLTPLLCAAPIRLLFSLLL